ncbi:hypothetical protein GCM10009112_24990 [Marinomonas arenicola]
MVKELILDALMMAIWRRKPKQRVTIHSDQGSQFTSYDWHNFLDDHNLQVNMSRRENCHDNTVAESFFQLLKQERVKRKIYSTRGEAKQDIFNYIEMFYHPAKRHSANDMLPPVEYEKRFKKMTEKCLLN